MRRHTSNDSHCPCSQETSVMSPLMTHDHTRVYSSTTGEVHYRMTCPPVGAVCATDVACGATDAMIAATPTSRPNNTSASSPQSSNPATIRPYHILARTDASDHQLYWVNSQIRHIINLCCTSCDDKLYWLSCSNSKILPSNCVYTDWLIDWAWFYVCANTI